MTEDRSIKQGNKEHTPLHYLLLNVNRRLKKTVVLIRIQQSIISCLLLFILGRERNEE